MRTSVFLFSLVGCITGLLTLPACVAAAERPITYEDQVATILKKRCGTCHGDTKQESGLSLTSYAGVMKGSGGGKIVVAGRASGSRLIEVITSTEPGERMPPDGERVPDDQVAVIKQWIDTGLREHAGSTAAAMRTLGFTPSSATSPDAPGAVPQNLPAMERTSLHRPFPRLALAASPRASVAAAANYGVVELFDPVSRNPLGGVAFPRVSRWR